MKKISVKREIIEDRWQTVDGIDWDNEDKAREWEKRLECVALKQLEGNMKNISDTNQGYYEVSWMAGIDGDVKNRLFRPKSEEDIKNFLMYCELSDKNILRHCQETMDNLKVGETYVIFEEWEYDNLVIFSKESFDKFIKERTEIFNNLLAEIDKEEE